MLACPEPGWLIHVLYWFDTHPRSLLRAVLDAFDVISAELDFEVLSRSESNRMREACRETAFFDKGVLLPLLAKTQDSLVRVLHGRLGDSHTLSLSLSQSLGLNAARLQRAASPSSALSNVDDNLRACCALLALASIHCENGQRDEAALCLARACSLIGECAPSQKSTVVETLKTARNPPLPPARVIE